MQLSTQDRGKLEAAQRVINRLLEADERARTPRLSRGPDGRHLDAQGVADLYEAFDNGLTPYQAAIRFVISPRAASLRYAQWKAGKAQ